MYCKYCGGVIAPGAEKCMSCGASIDFNDGGQSFFDDNELNAWRGDAMMSGVKNDVPKTEMREAAAVSEDDFEAAYGMNFEPSAQRGASEGGYARARARKKGNLFDFSWLSGSNRLIVFCIASALVIVLLAVAIIAVLSGGSEDTATDATKTQTVDSGNAGTEDKTEKEEKNLIAQDREEVKGIKILINNREISHPVSAYMVNGEIYVSIDRVLNAEGYNVGVRNTDNENRVRYKHKTEEKAVEIEKGTDKIWIIENSSEEATVQKLDGVTFNVDTDTYVPAESFFTKIGYSKAEYNKSTVTLTVSK